VKMLSIVNKFTVTSRLLPGFTELQKERAWSQKHLAGTAGVDQGFISRLESGKTEPCLETLATLARAFGLSLSELLKGMYERLEKQSGEGSEDLPRPHYPCLDLPC
jgi:transcriptional regulator with XRE-family HTH domain